MPDRKRRAESAESVLADKDFSGPARKEAADCTKIRQVVRVKGAAAYSMIYSMTGTVSFSARPRSGFSGISEKSSSERAVASAQAAKI